MRLIKFFLIIAIVIASIGYGVYHFGTSFASEKIMEEISTELESSGEIENIKQTIESDPELKSFVEDAASADESSLPFTTKEEATRVAIKRIGISGLEELQSKISEGQMTKEEIMQEVEKNFTAEEIEALKVIAYKELYHE